MEFLCPLKYLKFNTFESVYFNPVVLLNSRIQEYIIIPKCQHFKKWMKLLAVYSFQMHSIGKTALADILETS